VKQSDIAGYIAQFEGAVCLASKGREHDFEGLLKVLIPLVETIVRDLDAKIRSEGVNYNSPNEPMATARALLWTGWVSWLWTSKAEGRNGLDVQAQAMRPIVEGLLEQFILTGRLIGKDGGRPETFLQTK
jgi:hypothetical protein